MSYELQLAAEAKAIAEAVREKVAAIEEHLGEEFKAFMAEVEAKKAAVAEANKPLELSPEEKQAVINARAEILKASLAKVQKPATQPVKPATPTATDE